MEPFKTRLREKALARQEKRSIDVDAMDLDSVKQLVEELQTHKIELEIQNEELREAQDALEISKSHYKSLFDKAPVGYVILDRLGMIQDHNNAFDEMVGFSRDALFAGAPFADLLVDTDAHLFRSRFKALFKQPEGKIITYRVQKDRNDVQFVQIKARKHLSYFSRENQTSDALLLMLTDVTELHLEKERSDRALKASQLREQEVTALLDGARAVLKQSDFQTTARRIFDICSDVIGSQSGYVALLSEEGDNNEVLFLEDGGLPCTVDPDLPMPIRGLREQAYRTNETVYDNFFMDSKWASLMPHGHVRLENVMFAPLVINQKTVGIIGLANKPGHFTERDAYIAHGLGKICAIALQNSWNMDERDRSEAKNRELIEELKKALENVKLLSGLLPICSHCKKIRDDKGYWKQLEGYIQEHSEAVFSHSICQECAKIHYPDFDLYKDE